MMTSNRSEIIREYMSCSLSVLALWIPWAILCVAPDPEHDGQPGKRHETRHWYPRGIGRPFRVAIHAAKKFDGVAMDALAKPSFRDAVRRCGFYPGNPRPFLDRRMTPPGGLKPLPLGAIVGVATVTAILSAQNVDMQAGLEGVQSLELDSLSADDRAFGLFTVMPDEERHTIRYAWRLEHALMLPEPVPHVGRQDALYPVDGAARDAINEQLRWMEMAS